MEKYLNLRGNIALGLVFAFLVNTFGPLPTAQAEELHLPAPGVMVHLSPAYTPAYLKGIVIHPENALKFDFLVHKGDGNLDENQKKEEYTKLIKYFLASLTVPDKDQWVNLSPYEKNRIIEGDFGKTEMGRDLLGQDYLLKQITASLMYPESGLGKNFWDKVYERAFKEYGTTNIPVNTFNKVWIVPDEALIYESGNTAYVVKSHLKVMLEEDYLALSRHSESPVILSEAKDLNKPKDSSATPQNDSHSVASKVIKEIILPEIEREVNEGKNFAILRQVFSGMLLATWYKKALKESLLGKIYADKAKVQGVDVIPAKAGIQKDDIESIYQKYLSAFKKGVYNYIKEDADKYTDQVIPRKYFAGGVWNDAAQIAEYTHVSDEVMDAAMRSDGAATNQDLVSVAIDQAHSDNAAMIDRAMTNEVKYARLLVSALMTATALWQLQGLGSYGFTRSKELYIALLFLVVAYFIYPSNNKALKDDDNPVFFSSSEEFLKQHSEYLKDLLWLRDNGHQGISESEFKKIKEFYNRHFLKFSELQEGAQEYFLKFLSGLLSESQLESLRYSVKKGDFEKRLIEYIEKGRSITDKAMAVRNGEDLRRISLVKKPKQEGHIIELMSSDWSSYVRMSKVFKYNSQVDTLRDLLHQSQLRDAVAYLVPVGKLPKSVKAALAKLEIEIQKGKKINFLDIMGKYFKKGIIFTPYMEKYGMDEQIAKNKPDYIILNEHEAGVFYVPEGTLIMRLSYLNPGAETRYVETMVRASIRSLMRYHVTSNSVRLEQSIEDKEKLERIVGNWVVLFRAAIVDKNTEDDYWLGVKESLEVNRGVIDRSLEDFRDTFRRDFAMTGDVLTEFRDHKYFGILEGIEKEFRIGEYENKRDNYIPPLEGLISRIHEIYPNFSVQEIAYTIKMALNGVVEKGKTTNLLGFYFSGMDGIKKRHEVLFLIKSYTVDRKGRALVWTYDQLGNNIRSALINERDPIEIQRRIEEGQKDAAMTIGGSLAKRKGGRPVSEKVRIFEAWLQGLKDRGVSPDNTQAELAKMFDITQSSVSRILNKFGYGRSRGRKSKGGWSPDKVRAAVEKSLAKDDGKELNMAALGKEVGVSRERIRQIRKKIEDEKAKDKALISSKGGIDMNSANLNMQIIKRDGNGVPLPISQQDMAQLSQIKGFVPRILEIRPALSLFYPVEKKSILR